jgi:dTDP-4-amino-4,6-dideoxygalactose transaminase
VNRMNTEPTLALAGGPPVRERPWPEWPRVTARTEAAVLDALRSRRWTVSGPYTGVEPYERRFAEAFAAFHGVPHCVPTCHGSSALVVALEALGVGPGSEVLVPGLTWVACASAVAGVGAVPVLVDIDLGTLGMSLSAAEAAITERTKAIMVVHMFCSAADLDGFVMLAERHCIPLIEDCSQAHGARWRGRRVGSFGTVAAFSFQQTKLLTSGEGGAVLCSDTELADRMQELRADGRRYCATPRIGHLDLEEVGVVQGRNYCLSELHAALLLEGLERLDGENDIRRRNAEALRKLLAARVPGVRLLDQPEQLEPAYYHLCLRIDRDAFAGVTSDWVAEALTAELGILAEPVDTPLNCNALYAPLKSPRTAPELRERLDPARFELPMAAEARRTCLTMPHRTLLGAEADMAEIADALEKIQAAALAGIVEHATL